MTVLLDLIDEVSGIKQDIKTAINNKGGSLDNDTPFADYADAIDNIPTAEAVLDKSLQGDLTFNVQTLGDSMLANNNGLTSIDLPNCTQMGERCIQNCQSLISANIPVYAGQELYMTEEGDVYVGGWGGQYCFEFCYNLLDVAAQSLKIIPSDFFAECKKLDVLDADNIYGIYGNSFRAYDEYDPEYHRVTVYEQLEKFDLDFMNFKFLDDMNDVLRDYINDSNNNVTNTLTFSNLQCIGKLFRYDDSSDVLYNITTVSVPDLRHVNDWSDNRWNVTTLSLPVIRHLGSSSFTDCDALTTINIGNKVRHISDNAFGNCNNVTTVNIDIDQNTQDQEIIDNVINTAPWGLDQSVTINWAVQ